MTKEYEIGYGKPPKANQYPKGVSGNAKGRPKGSKNFKTILAKELDSHIWITEGGKKIKITKRELIAKVLFNKGSTGDFRSIQALINFDDQYQEQIIHAETLDGEACEIDIEKVLKGLGV